MNSYNADENEIESVEQNEEQHVDQAEVQQDRKYISVPLVIGAIVSTIGFAIPAGYGLGVLNLPVKILQAWCNETLIRERDIVLTKAQLDSVWSLIVSVFIVGGVIGGLTGAWFADNVGRKNTLIFGNVLNLISSNMFFISKSLAFVEIFFGARALAGFTAGLMTTVVPMYLTELSPAKISGIMGMLFPIGLTIGVLISQIAGLDYLLGTPELWPCLVGGYCVTTMLVFVLIPWLPESPKYLYEVLKEEEKAIAELSKLRGLSRIEVYSELYETSQLHRRAPQEKWSIMKVFATPNLRLPLALVIALQAGQQFSGINAVFFYSAAIFRAAGLSENHIPYAIIGTGLINLVVCAFGLLLVNTVGRKKMLVFSCISASLFLFLLTLSSRFANYAAWVPYFSVSVVLLYVLVYNLGLGPIPYFIGAELVGTGPRPAVMALGSVANWGANFLVGIGYVDLHNIIQEYVFLIFSGCTFMLSIFIIFYLPTIENSPNELTNEDE